MVVAVATSPSVTDWMSALGMDFAAVGTVAALIFLGVQAFLLSKQTSELHRQNEAEAKTRREDAERARMEFRSRHTPFLSLEVVDTMPETTLNVRTGVSTTAVAVALKVHADGAGVAHNVIVNPFLMAGLAHQAQTTTTVIPFLRAPGQGMLTLAFPPGVGDDEAHWFRLEVRFLNMFNEAVTLVHSARFKDRRFEITDAPVYEWPWPIP
ncbi:MAG: hypothetical protein M3256_03410 [Actinomycetota bacterium]|nr:hypothetical protein [Candidatus Dormibacteraeota bacterium]MDQ6945323.1 hypothetical protein [Actinomycetota bacterium]